MRISRRQFVSWGLAAGAAVGANAFGQRYLGHVMRTSSRMHKPIPSVCRACPAGCGIVGYRDDYERLVAILGDPEHPVSRGKVCALAPASLNLHTHPERLLKARLRSGETMETAEAVAYAGEKIGGLLKDGARLVVDSWDPPAMASFVEYPNSTLIDRYGQTRRRLLAEASPWGCEIRPAIERSDLLLVFEAQPLDGGPQFVPEARRIVEGIADRGMKMIVFDPVLTATGSKADLWAPLRPHTSRFAALAMLREALLRQGWDFAVPTWQEGETWLRRDVLPKYELEFAAQVCGVEASLLAQAAEMLAAAHRPTTICGPALVEEGQSPIQADAISLIDYTLGESSVVRLAERPVRFAARQSVAAEGFYRELAVDAGQNSPIVLITHRANPVYERGAEFGELLRQGPVAFHLSVSPLPNETTATADLVIPEALPLECADRVWLNDDEGRVFAARQQPLAVPPPDVRPGRDLFAALAGEIARYVEFPSGGIRPTAETPATGDERFQYVDVKRKNDPYTLPLAALREMAEAKPPAAAGAEFELVLRTDAVTHPASAQAKWLAEISHTGRLFMHPDDARRLRLYDGDRVRLTAGPRQLAPVEVFLSNGVRPGCLSLLIGHGRRDAGKLAAAERFKSEIDPDMKLIWWSDEGGGVNPLPLRETIIDPGAGDRQFPLNKPLRVTVSKV